MRGETQADALASLVQKKKKYPEYELALPSFCVKQSQLKKLREGDILLVGMSGLELVFYDASGLCAEVMVFTDENIQKLKITHLYEDTVTQEHTKKYETLKCSLGILQCRKLEVGHKMSIPKLIFEEVKVLMNDDHIADGRLVDVDNEIAIKIVKVNI